jgi:branched-chain amino acid transport system ATP-binding protein
MTLLELKRVGAGYGHLPVLFDIDMDVDQGEMVTVLGSNGAGKSTLLKTILGAVPPSAGEINFRGQRVSSLPSHKRVGLGMALSPEGRQVFPTLSVKENLVTGAYGVDTKKMNEQFDRCFELFPRLKERATQHAGSLSGGEQQMLAVSRALMSRPRLLMVDELSLGLAPIIAERLYAALRALCDEGLSCIMVEQFHLTAVGFSDKQYVMEKGRFIKVTSAQTKMAQKTGRSSAASTQGQSSVTGRSSVASRARALTPRATPSKHAAPAAPAPEEPEPPADTSKSGAPKF